MPITYGRVWDWKTHGIHKALVYDLDGTLYNGLTPIKGRLEEIKQLALTHKIFFMTNNSGNSQKQLVAKLTRMGFPATKENTYCVSYAMWKYLKSKNINKVHLIGSIHLRKELERNKIKVDNLSKVPAVVIGRDTHFSYKNICVAMDLILEGAKLFITNDDANFIGENNQRIPGCGAMVGAIIGTTNHQPDFNVGKPNTYMLKLLCREHNLTKKDIMVVGDGVDTDIKMAKDFGCKWRLV